jgi:hypothetical protein
MTPSHPELKAVGARISEAIQLFYDNRMKFNSPFFHADDLRVFVETVVGKSAPGSADRILREMRRDNKVNYSVVDRAKSLYKLLPLISTKGAAATAPKEMAAAA